jgi:hypothetical protein
MGEAYDSVRFVPLSMQRARVLMPEYDPNQMQTPLCKSRDAERPDDNVEDPFNDICDGCPKAQWGENRQPPECRDLYNVLALMLIDEGGVIIEQPFLMTVKGASIKPFKQVISYGKLRNYEPYQFEAVMRSTKAKTWAGFAMAFSGMKPIEPKNKHEAHFMALTGQSVKVAVDADQVEDEELPF